MLSSSELKSHEGGSEKHRGGAPLPAPEPRVGVRALEWSQRGWQGAGQRRGGSWLQAEWENTENLTEAHPSVGSCSVGGCVSGWLKLIGQGARSWTDHGVLYQPCWDALDCNEELPNDFKPKRSVVCFDLGKRTLQQCEWWTEGSGEAGGQA